MNSLHIETSGQGPDLVLLHGWAMHSGIWGSVRDSLAQRFRLHLVDLPGHGLSPMCEPGTLEHLTGIVADILPENCMLGGWSLGGLVALWREALLAQAVLRGETRGYRNHPQLDRFKNHSAPLAAISLYLRGIHEEAKGRNYAFDISKIKPVMKTVLLTVTTGQMAYEWAHLLAKLEVRNPALYRKYQNVEVPEAHSIFTVCGGDVESWERY